MNPNEEMMKILQEFFNQIIYQERKTIYNKMEEEEEEINHKTDFLFGKDKNFLCFMRHNFTEKKCILVKIWLILL